MTPTTGSGAARERTSFGTRGSSVRVRPTGRRFGALSSDRKIKSTHRKWAVRSPRSVHPSRSGHCARSGFGTCAVALDGYRSSARARVSPRVPRAGGNSGPVRDGRRPGRVAQLGRAPSRQGGGRGFETRHDRASELRRGRSEPGWSRCAPTLLPAWLNGRERPTTDRETVGSTPAAGTTPSPADLAPSPRRTDGRFDTGRGLLPQ